MFVMLKVPKFGSGLQKQIDYNIKTKFSAAQTAL